MTAEYLEFDRWTEFPRADRPDREPLRVQKTQRCHRVTRLMRYSKWVGNTSGYPDAVVLRLGFEVRILGRSDPDHNSAWNPSTE